MLLLHVVALQTQLPLTQAKDWGGGGGEKVLCLPKITLVLGGNLFFSHQDPKKEGLLRGSVFSHMNFFVPSVGPCSNLYWKQRCRPPGGNVVGLPLPFLCCLVCTGGGLPENRPPSLPHPPILTPTLFPGPSQSRIPVCMNGTSSTFVQK